MLKFIYMIKIFLSIILTLFGLSCFANLPVDQEQLVKAKINDWYAQLGLAGKVSSSEFEAAVKGYFHYKKKGTIPEKNIIGIVNFKIPSTEKRFFIFQIGTNAKMLREEWVGHGEKSGPAFGPANSFSNKHESHQSSKGFYKTAETYHGKYGFSLRLDGLEPGVNDQVRSRAVVAHGARYTGPGQGGRSWGCLSLAMNRKDPVINLLKGGVLIYGSDGVSHNDYAFMGGSGSISEGDLGSVPGTDNDPGEEISSSYVSFDSVEEFKDGGSPSGDFDFGGGDFGALGTAGAIPSLASMADQKEGDPNSFSEETTSEGVKVGGAPLHGTSEFEECQNRASAPWDIVIAEASKPAGDPAKYFKATYNKLNSDVQNMDQVPDSVIKNMAIDNHAKNERCVALARMMKDSYTDKPNKNEPEEYQTVDGAIKCKYESAESQDYIKCKKMVDTYNQSLVDEKNMNEEQLAAFKEKGTKDLEEIKKNTGSIQVSAAVVQTSMTSSQASIANERSRFQVAKLETINQLQAAMPNRDSLLNDCRGYMTGKEPGKNYLKAFVGYLEVKDKSVPPTIDPCLSVVKVMNTNLVQNIPARKQAIKVIEKAGLKALDFNDKERALLDQNDMARGARIGNSSASSLDFKRYDNNGSDPHLNKFGFGGKVDMSPKGCADGSCDYSGGSGSLKINSKKNGRNSNYDSYASIAVPGYLNNDGKVSARSKVLTFDEKKQKRGVFDERFYENVNLALAGKLSVDSLSKEQKAEYLALLELKETTQNRGRGNGQTQKKNEKDGARGTGKEIWFDKSLDLFKIISNRYQKVFDQL